eukprot:8141906-Pyramimonas_sp.AAC.1
MEGREEEGGEVCVCVRERRGCDAAEKKTRNPQHMWGKNRTVLCCAVLSCAVLCCAALRCAA